MKTNVTVLLLSVLCWTCIGCNTPDLKQPVLFGRKPLPESYNSPDGCTINKMKQLRIKIKDENIVDNNSDSSDDRVCRFEWQAK
jgi:hypothetical protein